MKGEDTLHHLLQGTREGVAGRQKRRNRRGVNTPVKTPTALTIHQQDTLICLKRSLSDHDPSHHPGQDTEGKLSRRIRHTLGVVPICTQWTSLSENRKYHAWYMTIFHEEGGSLQLSTSLLRAVVNGLFSHPFPSVFINFYPLRSIFTHFPPFLSTFLRMNIGFHPCSSGNGWKWMTMDGKYEIIEKRI